MDKPVSAEFTTEDFITDISFIHYYLQSNQEDKRFWEDWLDKHPSKKADAAKAMEILGMLFLRLPDSEYLSELEKIKSKTTMTAQAAATKPSLIRFLQWKKVARKRRVSMVYLAAALFLAALGYFFLQHFPVASEALSEKHNNTRLPIEFLLSDSTRVTLAGKSTLRYRQHFGNGDRNVYLAGDASFHVKRDEVHPFRVFEDGMIATVLGTVFNVREQPEDSLVVVELVSGSVQIDNEKKTGSIILSPNERLFYASRDGSMYKEKWQPSTGAFARRKELLTFSKSSFEQIAAQMKTVFGITLVNLRNDQHWRFTGEFTNVTAMEVVENICLIEHLTYQLKGDTVLMK